MAEEVITALQEIKRGDGTEIQPILHLQERENGSSSSYHRAAMRCNEVSTVGLHFVLLFLMK